MAVVVGKPVLEQGQDGHDSELAKPAAEQSSENARVSLVKIGMMLSFNFTNGVLLASYMLLVLPMESERISAENRSSVLGSLMFIAGITQLINPIVGLVSDRWASTWGRRRPFILAGGMAGSVGILAQDFASSKQSPELYYVAYTVSMCALNTAYTAVVGIMADLIPASQSGTASGIAALLTLLGANAGFLFFNATHGSTPDRLHAMYMMYTWVVMVPVFITMLSCNEVPQRPAADLADLADSAQSSKDDELSKDDLVKEEDGMLSGKQCPRNSNSRFFTRSITYRDVLEAYYIDPREHADFSLVFWSRTLYYVGASVQTFFKFYLKDVLGIEDAEAAIVKTAVIGQIFAALTAIPTGLISDRVGKLRKPFIYFACVVLCAGNVANCLARKEDHVYVIAAILGSANGIYLAMDAALALDTLPNSDEAARFMGVWGIGCFLGSALGPVVGGPVLSLCGRSLEKPDAYNFSGYAILLGFAAFCFLASGAVLFYVGRKVAGPESPVSFMRSLNCRWVASTILKYGGADSEKKFYPSPKACA
mmetsp:Transcript_95496/g.169566  ORF Transcript_95496/g.169566 Transcript_95496/m.169566 type:complete len:538 (+) Transcript_95496:44-1657(+)